MKRLLVWLFKIEHVDISELSTEVYYMGNVLETLRPYINDKTDKIVVDAFDELENVYMNCNSIVNRG